ncbi:MAG: propanediol utilization microcompartment protein PduB [Anaerovoracaceae bacterium]|jgi:microcompartment protein PduB
MDSDKLLENCSRKEFVGTAALDTIGMAIAGIDETLLANMNVDTDLKAIGILTSRCGAAGQFMALDDAVKMTNCRVLSIELPLDAKNWGGHGCYCLIGSRDVSDVREAIKIAIRLTDKYVGEVYTSDAGHLEFCFSAQAGDVLVQGLQAEKGRAYGFMTGSPAGIGLVMADNCLKSAPVDLIWEMSPFHGAGNVSTHWSNEVMISFKGDAGNVKEAVLTSRAVGLDLLKSFNVPVESVTTPYL